jgi:RNA polymerase sigma-70 factor (ECF subfamily)
MKQELNISNQQLGEWIDEWQESLFRYAFFRVGDRADAEDIVQDAFLKIASSTTTVHNPKAYLYRVVTNSCINLQKRKSRFQPIEPKMPSQSSSDEYDAREEQQRIARLLGSLPDKQAEVIRLHIHAELKFTEIAEVLEIPVTTVKSRFSSGIERLKQLFIN